MRLNELLGIRYPLIQGGMANIATGAFAAAVSNAGALGLIGSAAMDAGQLREEIRIAKSLTKEKFGVNLMLMNPHIEELAQTVIEEDIRYLTTGAGNPGKYMKRWKEAGIFVMPVVASVALARKMEKEGADAIIAEGTESGGHVGELTTMALVPQVADAVKLPVIAAGGVADYRQLQAAFALGAVGAQIGTCLLVAEECPVHPAYKEALIKARDTDITVTGRIAGTPVRILKNRMAREYVRKERAGASMMELEEYTLGSLRRAVFDGDVQMGSVMAGQVAGQLRQVRSVAEILRGLVEGKESKTP